MRLGDFSRWTRPPTDGEWSKSPYYVATFSSLNPFQWGRTFIQSIWQKLILALQKFLINTRHKHWIVYKIKLSNPFRTQTKMLTRHKSHKTVMSAIIRRNPSFKINCSSDNILKSWARVKVLRRARWKSKRMENITEKKRYQ